MIPWETPSQHLKMPADNFSLAPHHHFMGIVNITPNSFSDGGEINSPEALLAKIKLLYRNGFRHIDIGAESTAPMNLKVDEREEKRRYQQIFLPCLEYLPRDITLSFDTYKLEVMDWVMDQLTNLNYCGPVWWNCVAGNGLQLELVNFLKKWPSLNYVYCHNLAKRREDFAKEIDFTQGKGHFLNEMKQYFGRAHEFFKSAEVLDRVVFDPAFGFYKSREQNLKLMEKLEELIGDFSQQLRWLIGISRKRQIVQIGAAVKLNYQQADRVMSKWLMRWSHNLKDNRLFFRVHH